MKIESNIYLLRVSIPIPALKVVNSYLIDTGDDLVIIDPGIGLPDSIKSLERQLDEYGYNIEDIRHIIITHLHVDHIGGAYYLQKVSGAEVYIHETEVQNINEIVMALDDTLTVYREVLESNGVPTEVIDMLATHHPGFVNRKIYSEIKYDNLLSDRDRIRVSNTTIETVWTPGHSRGHICLYLPKTRMLLSGDHILPSITPNIRIPLREDEDPLNEYFESLKKVGEKPIDIYLPGHGDPSKDIFNRVDELRRHHIERLLEVNRLVLKGGKTIYEMATKMDWDIDLPWKDFPLIQKFFAFSEAAAHVIYLYKRGYLSREMTDQVYLYRSIIEEEELRRRLEEDILL
jgi:glyoxylase-like metal-dependent hydrolase (beta-lactamase superfamily II)